MASIRLVWFRGDLRSEDNAALLDAARHGSVVGVYCLCGTQWRRHGLGGPQVDFVLRCLEALSEELGALGIPLRILAPGTFEQVPEALVELARELGAAALHFNDEYPLDERRRDDAVESRARAAGIEVHRHHDTVVRPPGSVTSASGGAYVVFTPFRKRWLAGFDAKMLEPTGRPPRQRRPARVESDPVPDPPHGFASEVPAELWPAGEREAARRLERFAAKAIEHYAKRRDRPALDATSRLSPYLSVGAISARRCLARAAEANDWRFGGGRQGPRAWITELIWREFYRHVIAAYPHVSRGHAFRREYDAVAWRDDPESLSAWREGRTGIPLVDAAMRQLAATGWMHNRLRMVVAMFLTKNLLIDWREGERHFLKSLVDADFASNNGGWQWSASTGTDAAPYFRVFNPVTQSQRFDPDGRFIRHWVPELAPLSDRLVHEPWRADVELDYPAPIVDLKGSRRRAIDAFRRVAKG